MWCYYFKINPKIALYPDIAAGFVSSYAQSPNLKSSGQGIGSTLGLGAVFFLNNHVTVDISARQDWINHMVLKTKYNGHSDNNYVSGITKFGIYIGIQVFLRR
jgi:hypothetical protein